MITDDRWNLANSAEQAAWDIIMNNIVKVIQEDGFTRHAPVMFLNRDDVSNRHIIDIGGGPISIMLHFNLKKSTVVDPLSITDQHLNAYLAKSIFFIQEKAEDFLSDYNGIKYDEVWMYNCLQHTKDPEFILRNLHKVSKVLRISEPCNTVVNDAHPHTFTPEWYHKILSEISTKGEWNQVNYDHPYVGGLWELA